MRILVTGGAGFIGSAVCRHIIADTAHSVVNLDKLTYAANLASVEMVAGDPRYAFVRADICDAPAMAEVFRQHDPDAVLHLAAESHVDRSIEGPSAFVETNVVGTSVLLEAARRHFETLDGERRERFRFVHVSTDEGLRIARVPRACSPRRPPTTRRRPIPPRRRRPIIWRSPGTAPSGCR